MSNIFVDDVVVDEASGTAIFTVRLDVADAATVTVDYTTGNLTAFNGSDYTGVSGTLTFLPGQTVNTIPISILNDSSVEALEHFTLTLSNPSANATIADDFAFGSIVDNDAPVGVPVVSISDVVVDEADKTATFVVTLSKQSSSVVSMNYATQNGTAVAGSDFVATNGTLNFAPGEMVKTVKVTLVNDTALEAAEAFTLALTNLTNATSLDPIGTAIIAENDATQVVSSRLSVDDIVVDETQAFAEFIVRLDVPNLTPVTVDYTTGNLTAFNGSDYNGLSGTLYFAAGETVKVVRLPIVNDSSVEALEHFTLTLSNPSANATIADDFAFGSIVDNDAPVGTPAASLTDAVVNETDHTVTVTVILDKRSTVDVSFTVASQDVTATANSDFRALSTLGTISFAPGETAKTVTFGLLKDTAVESAEMFDVVLSSPVGATIADSRGHVTIVANSATLLATSIISASDVVVSETQAFAEFIVRLDVPNLTPVTVDYTTGNLTAFNGSDYNGLSGTLYFAAGETVKTVRIPIVNDGAVEALEQFRLNLSNPSANATIGNATATATIIDNESPAPAAPIAIAGTTDNDVLKGTQFADAMTGGNGNDVLDGGAGNDSYDGGAGNDIYIVEDAGDTYTEAPGGGTDLVISYLSTHTLGGNVENLTLAGSAVTGIGNSENNTIIGNASNNTIEGGVGDDILDGGAGTDTVSYNGAAAGVTVNLSLTTPQNTIGAGTDTLSNFENLRGSNFNDTLTGDAKSNILIGGLGDDVLNGAGATDTVSYETATAGVTVSLLLAGAQNTVNAGTDTLSNFENLRGSSFNDTLTGNGGTNILTGGLGDDVLNGDAGSDTASYETSAAGVTVSLAVAGAQNTVGAGTDTLSNFENLRGSNFNDTLTGNAASNVLIGHLGNDVLDGGAGTDTASYETATSGVTVSLAIAGAQNTIGAGTDTLLNFEHLRGGVGNDTLTGNGGSNILTGGLGNDVLDGGAGTDTASYDTAFGGVTVNLGVAGAQNTVNAGTDTLSNFENLKGSIHNDTLTGNAANNVIIGDQGNDIMNGGAGIDTASYETAKVGVTVSLAIAGAQNTVGAGIDTLSNFEDLRGGNFNDTLTGNGGNNTLTGGLGNDTMTGNAGQDSFGFNTALNATTNTDTITDFSVVDDTLVLENAIFTQFAATGAIPAGTFVANAGGVAGDANDFLLYDTNTGKLFYDADGNGAGAKVEFVTLVGIPAITIADFAII